MSEFKVVVEKFEENQKRIVEVMNYRFDQVDAKFEKVNKDIFGLKEGVHSLKQPCCMRVKQRFARICAEKYLMTISRCWKSGWRD
ncbi:hypothetical protein KAR34_09105 [bacterium]|nr:hypothetical protein [bacterium]